MILVYALYAALMAGGLALAGCGIADSRSPVPEFMRGKASEPPPPDPPPDVKRLVRENSVFVAASNPHRLQVSPPRRDIKGSDWAACVRAELTSVMGKSLGIETYRITISGGVIIDRRRVEADDICASEAYEPV